MLHPEMAKLYLVSCITIIFLLHSASSTYFKITRFSPDQTNVALQGDAVISDGQINFNKIDPQFRVGWVTYAKRIRLWDSGTGKISDFTTDFSFIINTHGASNFGDGITFFMGPVGFQIPPNSNGAYLGLINSTTDGSPQAQVVFVEFDSHVNHGFDPPYGHVGINSNSISSVTTTAWNASFHSADTAEGRISYSATTKNMTVSWNYQTTPNPEEKTTLSCTIDLMQILPQWITIGFSVSTGLYVESNFLLSWEFNSTLDGTSGKSTKATIIIVGLAAGFLAVVTTGTVFVISRRRKRMMKGKAAETANLSLMSEELDKGTGPRKFSYQELVAATNNFSNERKLGKGGSGAVFRGYLRNIDMSVAVKRISRGSKGKREYSNELKTVTQLRHRNLVRLLGWCHDAKGDFLLVYEFMPNGSLDSHLYGKKSPLNWNLRYRAALGLASALLYIHEEWEQCVLHRDVKPSNIMLDLSFNVKLGDFGLARFIEHGLDQHTTGLAGTRGYMAPEYISTGRASKESDVFSFGVVALEIATGRSTVGSVQQKTEMSLVKWVWELYGEGKLKLAIDERLQSDFDEKQVECLMIVGLWCAHPDHNLRSSIRQAIQVLNFQMQLPDLPSKMPVPIYHTPAPNVKSVQPEITYSSIEVGR